MIVNLRLILALLLVFVGLTGCHRDDPDDFVPAPRPRVTLTLSLSAPGSISDAGTKAPVPATTAEKKIYNLNIFMFPKSTQPAIQEDKRHYNISGSQLIPDPADNTGTKYLPIELKDVCIGEYDVYIVANSDEGSLCSDHADDPGGCKWDHSKIGDLEVLSSSDFDPDTHLPLSGLLMSGKIEGMKVLAATEDVSLNLTFNMARVNFSYTQASEDAKKIDIYSLKILNAVLRARPFGDPNWVPTSPTAYEVVTLRNSTNPLSKNDYSTTFYLASNMQGSLQITPNDDPALWRTSKYAPLNATYAYFNCKYEGAVLGFTAYLGDDRPDEVSKIYFDILPNAVYNINTIFRKPDLNDDRLSSFNFIPSRNLDYTDFIMEGTSTPAGETLRLDGNGKVAIQTDFDIKITNHYNNVFKLTCQPFRSMGTNFRVYEILMNGTLRLIDKEAGSDYIFIVKTTGKDDGSGQMKIRVVFEQTGVPTDAVQDLRFSLNNRSGNLITTVSPQFKIRG